MPKASAGDPAGPFRRGRARSIQAIPLPAGSSARTVASLIEGRQGLVARPVEISTESLILAQDERWRRASHMQVEREARSLLRVESGERVRNT
jgi:hypothetical protein